MAHALLLLLALLLAPVADDLTRLRQEVDALKQAVAEAASQRALADLEARLERVRADLDRLLALRSGDEDVRRAIDSLGTQVAELERRVASLRVRSDDLSRGFFGIAAGYDEDEGFALRSADDRFVLRTRIAAQFRYEGLDVADHQELPQTPDRSSFLMPRARLDLGGNAYSPALTYRVLLDFMHDPILEEAWAEWAPCPCLAIRAGRLQAPFSRQWLVPEERFQLVDRADATDRFRPDRDLGVQLTWAPWQGRIQVLGALMNGSAPPALRNDNIDFAYLARLTVQPLGPMPRDEGDANDTPRPLLAVGGSFLYNLLPTDAALVGLPSDIDGDGQLDNVAVWQAGAEAAVRWRGASLEAELFYRHYDFGAARSIEDRLTYWGAYVQSGYFLIPRRVELAARYSWAQPSRFGLSPDARALLGGAHHEATVGGSSLFSGRLLKAQLEYSYLVDEEVPALPGAATRYSHRVRAQLQLAF